MASGGSASASPQRENDALSLSSASRSSKKTPSTYTSNPIPMAPSEKAIIDGIYAAIRALYAVDPETLTVRNVRNKVEADIGLEAGFLTNEAWKDKSKGIIKGYANELQEAAEQPDLEPIVAKPKVEKPKPAPAPKKAEPVKKGTKRAAPDPKRLVKRQKKQDALSEEETSELTEPSSEESEASDFGESEDSDAPKKKKGSKAKAKAPMRRQSKSKSKKVDSSDEEEDLSDQDSDSDISIEDEDDSDAPKKKTKSKPKSRTPVKRQSKSKAKVVDSDESEEQDSDASAPPKKKAIPKKATPKKAVPKKPTKAIVDSDAESEGEKPTPKSVSAPQKENQKDPFTKAPSSDAEGTKPTSKPEDAASESEMSIVLDPTPKSKRQRAPKGEKKVKEPKAPKEPKSKAPKAPAAAKDLSPTDLQIKTLQSQLKKCGVNKIWQFELKQYGDDGKKKTEHLQKVLREIGMVGRFSEARAREIKEMRELQADLEAVKEGERSWGLESGRRSRGAAPKKNLREASDDEEGSEDRKEDAGSESEEQPQARKPRARAGLAFLGDEEDSDE